MIAAVAGSLLLLGAVAFSLPLLGWLAAAGFFARVVASG